MKILITGSSGFIGSNLRRLLENKEIEVVSYDIRENPLDDVRDISRLREKVVGVDGIVHLAAVSRVKVAYQNPLQCIDINVGGIINILETAREMVNSPWVIFGSSREVFGESPDLPVTEESPLGPINVYGVSKMTGENLCQMFSKNYSLKTRIIRFSNVYTGTNDQLDRVIPKFILRAFSGKDLFINGTGEEMIFDFTYIDDLVAGVWKCIEDISKRNVLCDDFILGTGRPVSLKELAEIIVEKAGTKSKINYREARSYDVDKFYADPTKAKEMLGFSPKVDIKEGIEFVIKKFKKSGLIN